MRKVTPDIVSQFQDLQADIDDCDSRLKSKNLSERELFSIQRTREDLIDALQEFAEQFVLR